MRLTAKQDQFAQYVAAGMTQTDAYKAAYNCKPTTKPETIRQEASRLMNNPNIAATLANLRAPAMEQASITLEALLSELENGRQLAISRENPAAMINATMAKAKLLGLDKPEAGTGEQSVAEALVRLADRLPD
jgi:phage terminase small subunit